MSTPPSSDPSDAWVSPATATEAERTQQVLRNAADTTGPGPQALATVAGLDVAYAEGSPLVVAAVVVLDATTMESLETATAVQEAMFPYLPGLFAFREMPPLLEAMGKLTIVPDLLVCDGHGYAHPRRFGLASHIGVVTDLPAMGVAKTLLCGSAHEPESTRGSHTPVSDNGEMIGACLRTRTGVKPVYVSAGHRINLSTAIRHTLALCPSYRLPETTRQADRLARATLANVVTASPVSAPHPPDNPTTRAR
jgi:deoxyribonuclease V